MFKYLTRRLVYGLAILVGVNLLTFFLFFTVNTPDDMARLNIGGKRVSQEQIDKWKAERGYDKPLYWDASRAGTRAGHAHGLLGAFGLADAAGVRPLRRAPGRRHRPRDQDRAWASACSWRCRSSCCS